jgi:hypothetical protein
MNNPILNAVSYRTVMAGFFSQLKAAIDAALDFCREKHKSTD